MKRDQSPVRKLRDLVASGDRLFLDSGTTVLKLAEAVETRRALNWTSRAGKPCSANIAHWRTVSEALLLPEPDKPLIGSR